MYIPDIRKTDYENAIIEKLFINDIKNQSCIPTLINSEKIKIFQKADQPFIDHVYFDNKLILIWDHYNNKEIKTANF